MALNQHRRLYNWDLIYHPLPSNLNCKTKTKLQALDGHLNENRTLVLNVDLNAMVFNDLVCIFKVGQII